MRMTTEEVKVGEVVLTVRQWGDRSARPLIFWHGLNPFGALQLNEVGPRWGTRGFRVIAPAAPGAGDSPTLSDPDAYRPTRLAHLVAELAAALELRVFSFVGWSWGASIGVHLAAQYPQLLNALVLLDAGHTDVDATGSRADLEAAFVAEHANDAFDDWGTFFDAVRERVQTWGPRAEERFRAGMEERDGRIVVRGDPRAGAWALWGVATEPPSAALPLLANLALPILLVRSDRASDASELANFTATLPSAEVRSVDSGHDLLAGAPMQTAELVAAWLEDHVS